MKNKTATSLIILTRNEITGLTALINQIPVHAVDECFAVDYQSTDGTVEYFEKHHIPVVHQNKPGRSEAFRVAARQAQGDILVFFSPDGNENPNDIPKLIAAIKNGADMAIASRFMTDSRNEEDDQFFKPRKWANQGFTWLANFCFRKKGVYSTDSINGYRTITKKAFQSLHLNAEGFAIEYQMTMRAMKKRLTIAEIPTIEGNRVGGQSGSAAIPTGLAFIRYFLKELIADN